MSRRVERLEQRVDMLIDALSDARVDLAKLNARLDAHIKKGRTGPPISTEEARRQLRGEQGRLHSEGDA